MIYLQNMKFERLTVWPGGAYTDAAHGTKCKIFVKFLKTLIIFFYVNHFNYFLAIGSSRFGSMTECDIEPLSLTIETGEPF